MKCPVVLQTVYGAELYKIILNQYHEYKKSGNIQLLHSTLIKEREKVSRELTDFLNNEEETKQHKMDDKDEDGWVIYKELSDKYAVLNYFSGKV